MVRKQNKKLLIKVFFTGIVITILGYLFHPGVGQFSLTINGEPVADPLTRFAAVPTLLALLGITLLLSIILFFGFSLLMFLAAADNYFSNYWADNSQSQ
jgi:hypothetical protein